MEECLKSMNEENDNLKGKLGNVISNIGSPQDQQHISDNNNINHRKNSRQKGKKKKFSSINNNTMDDLRQKFKSNSNVSVAAGNNLNNNDNQQHTKQFLSHFKSNSMIQNNIEENEDIENNPSDEANYSRDEDERNDFICNSGNNNKNNLNNLHLHNQNLSSLTSIINKNEFINNNNNIIGIGGNNQLASAAGKKTKESNNYNLRHLNRNLTLGKNSHHNFNPGFSPEVSSNFIIQDNHFSKQQGSNSNTNDGHALNNHHMMYKMNPFIDNTSTFLHNDYDNINDKISNLDNIENTDNTNNLEEIEQMENEEEDSEHYGNEFPPLQLRIKNKKKCNKI